MRPSALLVAVLLAALARDAAATVLGGATEQVVIEAVLKSVSRHELMELGIDAFRTGERIDAPSETQLLADVGETLSFTGDAITALEADGAVTASPAGAAALGMLQLARGEQQALAGLLAEAGLPKAKQVRAPLEASRGFQVGAISALQARAERLPVDRRFLRDANALRDRLLGVLPWLADHGLPDDGDVLHEPFEVGRRSTLAERIGLNAGPGVRSRFRDGALELSGAGKTPADGSVDFQIVLPEGFTVVVRIALPGRLGAKQQAALADFSAGILVASDATPTPAEGFVVEHQTTPEGFAQTFTATTDNVILDVFPHPGASLSRVVTTAIARDGGTLTLTTLLSDGSSETKLETTAPVLGDLPVIGFYFRNGTARTRLRVDDLFVFVTPHLLEAAE